MALRGALLLLKKPVGWFHGGAPWGNTRAHGKKVLPGPGNLIPAGDDRTFDTSTGNWLATDPNRGTMSWDNIQQGLRLTNDGTTGFCRATLSIQVEAGKTYTFATEVLEGAFQCGLAWSTTASGDPNFDSTLFAGLGPQSGQITPTQANIFLMVFINTGTNDSRTVVFDNMSLTEG